MSETNRNKKLKVKTQNLRIGMYVIDVGKSWFNHPWLTRERYIYNQRDIEVLKQHGITEVLVDMSRSKTMPDHFDTEPISIVSEKPADHKGSEEDLPPHEQEPHQTSLYEELPEAEKVYMNALGCVKDFISQLQSGGSVDFRAVEAGVQGIVASVFRNSDACLTLTKLKAYDEYTFTHCLNVAVLSVTFGRHLNMTREKTLELGLAGIFHDIGKLRIPDGILNKPSKLNRPEWEVMKLHPNLGAYMLEKRMPNISKKIIYLILYHHERWDGGGYPLQKKGNEIDPNIYILALADVYDALTSHRVYHTGILPHEAVKRLFKNRDQHFPGHYVDQFIKSLGIYPAGSVVRLNTNEIGVVEAVNHNDLLHPTVRLVVNPKGYHLSQGKRINLAASDQNQRCIVKAMDHRLLGIDPAVVFQISPTFHRLHA